MKMPVKSWLLIAMVAAGIVACTSRGAAPLPAVPPAAVTEADTDSPQSNVGGCPTAKQQPSWIFLGACRFVNVDRSGTTVRLPSYRGYSARLSLPANTAKRRAQIGFVIATGVKDVKPKAGKAFPLNGHAVLYLQTVNSGSPIVFAKKATMTFTIRAAQKFVATQCGVAVLQNSAWVKLPGANAEPSGATVSFSFPLTEIGRVKRGPTFYSITCTQSGGPTPTPSLPPYCSNYSIPSGATVPLNITDDSGLGQILLVYITNGVDFMNNSGTFNLSTANPYPAACFSTTTGSPSTVALKLTAGISAGRIYFAYATPVPGQPNTVPNPMSGVSVSGPGFGYGMSPYPYDKIEYGLTGGAIIDTTQVDALGLPLELSVGATPLPSQDLSAANVTRHFHPHAMPTPCATSAPGIVGVTSCNFATIFTQMEGIAPYSQLVLTQPFAGKIVDMQIVSPQNASGLGFQLNLFALSTYTPSTSLCTSAPTTYGYLSCVMYNYQTAQRLYSSSAVEGVSGTSGDNYCAGSDNASNFIFTDVGAATVCASPTPKPATTPFNMPVQEFTYGVPVGSSGCTQNLLFGLPWGNAQVGAGQLFATPDSFAMWKAVGVDLNRGVALQTSLHPVGGSSPQMSDFFKDPLQSEYAYLLHYYFNQNLAYAIAFDDSGNFESGVTWQTGDAINIRINAIPTASSSLPSGPPAGLPVPSPCPSLPPGV